MVDIQTSASDRIENGPSLKDLTTEDAQKVRNQYLNENRIAIVGGLRTPFVRAGGALANYGFLDMGSHVVNGLVEKMALNPKEVNEIVYGTVLLDPRIPNAAREIVLRSGLPKSVDGHFVSNNCITGLVAIDMLSQHIATGRAKIGIAGGSESMSNPTLTLSPQAEDFYLALNRAKTMGQKLKVISSFRPKFLFPNAPSPKEPSTGLTMGEHCEITAKALGISREVQDRIALNSHINATRADKAGYLAEEILALGGVSKDNLIRGDTSAAKLAKLPPVFDRSKAGTISAGNSSPLTDGASAVCLMSEAEAKRQGREIFGYLSGLEFASVDPDDGLLMAPGIALPRLLERNNLKAGDVDRFEIHEAFGAQVAANLQIWETGWDKYGIPAIGAIPEEKINVNGGSIAIGHPFAATGGRVIMSLVNELRRQQAPIGVASVCAAGAMACAVLITRD